jgi:hypothetical protein
MAAMNKCLAPKNKSLDGDKATKNRPHRSLSCRAFVGRNCLTPVCEDKMELEYTLIVSCALINVQFDEKRIDPPLSVGRTLGMADTPGV